MASDFNETDLLLAFEKPRLRKDYREFFKAKRRHFFKTIEFFAKMWDQFQDLDEIWQREINAVGRPSENAQILPAQLLILAHGKFRIAGELAFCGCLGDTWAVMRIATELGAHANRIYRKPELARIWIHRDEDKKVLKQAFEDLKKERVFDGLASLYESWKTFSEWGSHSNSIIIALRSKFIPGPKGVNIEVSYMEGKESRMGQSLHLFLDAGWEIENVMIEIFKARLHLDAPLVDMRAKFEKRHAILREAVLAKYGEGNAETKTN